MKFKFCEGTNSSLHLHCCVIIVVFILMIIIIIIITVVVVIIKETQQTVLFYCSERGLITKLSYEWK